MSATVVVPTRDRPEALRRCLASVRAQQSVTLDIVVVDDGSVAGARVSAVAEAFAARLVRLDGEGPAAARNAGVRAVGTDRVLLLDDDCVPRAGWAESFVGGKPTPPRLVVAGCVIPPSNASPWLRASERIAVSAETGSRFFRTLNLSCGTELLRDVPFDETFSAAAGEDRDWCLRAASAGATFAREPAAIVEHRADIGARAFFGQQLRYGRAVHRLRCRGTHVAVPWRAHCRCLGEGFREAPAVGLAMTAAPAATVAGYVLERLSDRSG